MKPAVSTQWTIRPPWPDEMPRLEKHFPALLKSKQARRIWLWLAASVEDERFGAALALHETIASSGSAPIGRLEAGWRARRSPELPSRLLDAALACAQAGRFGSLHMQTDPDSPWGAALRTAGFSEGGAHELWLVSIPPLLAKMEALEQRALERWPVTVAALRADDLPSVRRLCAASRLLSPERVALAPAPDGFDPRLSFVAKDGDAVAAAVLGRLVGSKPYLEILVRDATATALSPVAPAILMLAFFRASRALGAIEATCAIRPSATPDIAALVKRAGARRLRQDILFSLNLPSPGSTS